MSDPAGEKVDFIVIGGGAAGFFSAITAAESGVSNVLIFERGPEVLTKVRISGGGRCNVTHDCYDPRELVDFYPRGQKNLRGPFHRWQPADTIQWFENRGVQLKIEEDGRVFPVSDQSQSVIDCLTSSARDAGVKWRTHCGVLHLQQLEKGFRIETTTHDYYECQCLLIATGGVRSREARIPMEVLGQSIVAPVPSLFTFKISDPRLAGLMGVSIPQVSLRIGTIESSGPLLITHWGLSGPAILKASAWGARQFAQADYKFELLINWTGTENESSVLEALAQQRRNSGARQISRRSIFPGITRRLWQRLCEVSLIEPELTWAQMTKTQAQALAKELVCAHYQVEGKSLNKEEFVTCGGVPLDEVQLKTMESKQISGLYFAGEVLDIDGITGGFNFQSAWTTGRLAGLSIAERLI
jgi:predicted Rossmann fold flavoprotein